MRLSVSLLAILENVVRKFTFVIVITQVLDQMAQIHRGNEPSFPVC